MRSLLALFVRALRQHTRAPSTYILRGGIALSVLFFLWSAHQVLSWMGAAGLRFFSILISANYLLVALLGLGTFASAIAEEKEEGTLGLMRMAGLSPLAILVGKSTSRLGVVLLLLLAQVPFTFLAVTLGGVSLTQILTAFSLLGTFLFALANVALFFSVLLPRSARAAMMTIAMVIGYSLACAAPYAGADWLVRKRYYGPEEPTILTFQSIGDWLWSVHPANHFTILASGGYLSLEITRSVLVHLGVGIAFFTLALWIFPKCCDSEAAYSTNSGPRVRRLRWLGWPKRAVTQAFAWKDFYFSMGGRFSVALRFALYAAFLATIFWLMDDKYDPRRAIAEGTWQMGLMLWHVEAVILALLMWGPEAWGKHIGAIVATPRTLRQISFEKIKAALMATAPSVALLVLAMIIGGSKFIEDYLVTPFRAVSWSGGYSYGYQRLVNLGMWVIQLGALLALIVNLSLRLKWTALPAALGIFLLSQMVITFCTLYLFYFRARAFQYANWAFLREGIVAAVFLVIIFFLVRNTHKLLLRRAAEG